MYKASIVLAPNGRDAQARPVDPTETHWFLSKDDTWFPIDAAEADTYPWRRPTFDEASLAGLRNVANLITIAVETQRLIVADEKIEDVYDVRTGAEITATGDGISFWVVLPRDADLAAMMTFITELHASLFYKVTPNLHLEFVLEFQPERQPSSVAS